MSTVDGTFTDAFATVRDAFERCFDDHGDVGASVCVMLDGEVVVDLWGGHVDETRSTPWTRDSITNVWSISKTMTSLCALLLVDRGELDLHAPVAKYWPEFGEGGKDTVEVRHVLGHTSGLCGWQEAMSHEDLADWEKATSLLARQEPWWEPGTVVGYHAYTQGYLVGELVRRVAGMTLGAFLREELVAPLGADFHIGLAAEHDGRVVRNIPPPPLPVEGLRLDSLAARTLANPLMVAEPSWETWWRRAEIPAANGHGNARSVAAIQAVLAGGGEFGGRRFLSEATCQAVFEEQARGLDLVLGIPVRFGMGYGLNSAETPVGPGARTCFWGGWGGSIVVADLSRRLTVAYVMNRMGLTTIGDRRSESLVAAAYSALEGDDRA